MTLPIHCPVCGSTAKLAGQKDYKPGITHALFTCANSDCHCEFYGEIVLTRSPLPGTNFFSAKGKGTDGGRIVATDC
ncbi:MAG: hypothetical protein LBS49_10280 [Candidatus Accumulibacter sp.]|jgi:hypothetical protein|nr:hypothetical protein [Accumulibacter sp.]